MARVQPQILVLDPSCAAAFGHHVNSLVDLAAAVAPRTARFVVNAALPDGAFPSALDVSRAFRSTVYDEPGLGPRPNGRLARRLWKLRRTFLMAAVMADRGLSQARSAILPDGRLKTEDWAWSQWTRKWPELEAVLMAHAGDDVRHIVAPSSDVDLICGLASLRERLPALQNATIHARIITPTSTLAALKAGPAASSAYRRVMDDRMRRVHLYVETGAMQRHLSETFELTSDVYPYLLSPPPFVPTRRGREAVFGFFGGKRNEKGYGRLVPILTMLGERIGETDPPIAVIIHASDVRGDEADRQRAGFAGLERAGLRIDFVAGAMTAADYQRRFDEIDVALLPYTGARYALSGSGIVCEALAMGKAIITSRGLSFGEHCDASNALQAGDDTEFAVAMATMARGIERYRAGAAERALTYQAEVRDGALLRRLTSD